VLGVLGAIAVSRFVTSMLLGIDSMDPAALVGSVALLGLAATVASYWPLRQATRVDPITVLRQ
jgi:ABC-type antimicrobial peptide transport system permease subunit